MSQDTAVYDAASEFQDRASISQRMQALLHKYPWLSSTMVLVVASIIFSFFNENFLTPSNISLILQQVAIVGAVAAGQTLIILTAGIDLSCGAIAVFSSMTMAKLVQGTPGEGVPVGWSIWLAFPIGLLVGMLGGAINGFLVTKVKLPPFIVTLGTFNVFLALTLTLTKGTVPSIEMDPFLLPLGHYVNLGPFRVTTGVLFMFAMYMVLAFVLRYTSWGRHVYALPQNQTSATMCEKL